MTTLSTILLVTLCPIFFGLGFLLGGRKSRTDTVNNNYYYDKKEEKEKIVPRKRGFVPKTTNEDEYSDSPKTYRIN